MVRLSDWVERAGRLALNLALMPLLRVTSLCVFFIVTDTRTVLYFLTLELKKAWRIWDSAAPCHREEPNQDMVERLTWLRSHALFLRGRTGQPSRPVSELTSRIPWKLSIRLYDLINCRTKVALVASLVGPRRKRLLLMIIAWGRDYTSRSCFEANNQEMVSFGMKLTV